jgi:hypothetical protein
LLDPLLTEGDVEEITGRRCSTLQKDRVAGKGIPFVRLGRLVRYRTSDVDHFIASLPTRRSTSETDGSVTLDSVADTAPSTHQLTATEAVNTANPEHARRQHQRRPNIIVSE